MSTSNYIKNVAIVGANGRQGQFIVKELQALKKHNLTIITRHDSTNPMPSGATIARVNYDDPDSLATAMRNQDALVITMNSMAPASQQLKLIEAAAAANVPFVLPNEWSPPMHNEKYASESLLGPARLAARRRIGELGKSAWIAMTTSFWYDYSLGWGETAFGLDYPKRTMTFFDDGMQKINTSTWQQCARAVARVLSLPITATEGPSLSKYKNKPVYISSFSVSQTDMFQSALRVSGTKEEDWTIKYEDASERYEKAKKRLQEGDRLGYIVIMYTRSFFKDAPCQYDELLDNEMLGLPEEDLDEFTKRGLERAKLGLK